jgi:hypothetical protein
MTTLVRLGSLVEHFRAPRLLLHVVNTRFDDQGVVSRAHASDVIFDRLGADDRARRPYPGARSFLTASCALGRGRNVLPSDGDAIGAGLLLPCCRGVGVERRGRVAPSYCRQVLAACCMMICGSCWSARGRAIETAQAPAAPSCTPKAAHKSIASGLARTAGEA